MFSKLAPGFPVSDSSSRAICFIGFTKSDQLQEGDTSFQGRDIMHVPVTSSHPSLARWQDTSRLTFCLLAVLTYSSLQIYEPHREVLAGWTQVPWPLFTTLHPIPLQGK